ncbi:hypothetical protein CPC08DRAFT_147956 [Agrocybe pediades]|nr:hypothetical protein CPC08DRAFT_147956 [Agrocybe pediades]
MADFLPSPEEPDLSNPGIDVTGGSSGLAEEKEVPYTLRKDEDYYMEDTFMVFQVGNRLFRIPTYLLAKESQLFGGMFSLPQNNESLEGYNDENPIVLPEEFSSDDFSNLLHAFYPQEVSLSLSLTTPKWISILNLSMKWNFTKLRAFAVSELERMQELTPLQKVRLGRDNKVSSWFIEGLTAYVNAPSPMTDDEAMDLDFEDHITTAYRVYRIQERQLLGGFNKPSVKQEIEEDFKEEIASLRADEDALRQAEPDILFPQTPVTGPLWGVADTWSLPPSLPTFGEATLPDDELAFGEAISPDQPDISYSAKKKKKKKQMGSSIFQI